jgi:hypothetical protein
MGLAGSIIAAIVDERLTGRAKSCQVSPRFPEQKQRLVLQAGDDMVSGLLFL